MENNQNKTSVHIYQEPLPRLNKEIRCSLPEPFSSSKINNRKLIKNLIKETIGNEASQAFIRIFDSKHLGLKLFWLISLLGCGSLSFYLVAETLFIYLSYPVYTTTKIVYEVPTVFPKVTICNAMPAITEYAYDLIKDINVKHYPNISIFNQDQVSEPQAESNFILEQINLNIIDKIFDRNTYDKTSQAIIDKIMNCYLFR